ncbi:hypothetical protein ASD50_00480 [Mesorhizobium sp. Root552]|nr:hypothetical protein ASD50_00480 [Mesorhizobium sp. Root552]
MRRLTIVLRLQSANDEADAVLSYLAIAGFLVIIGAIVKGFWSGDKVKPTEQRDDWHAPS